MGLDLIIRHFIRWNRRYRAWLRERADRIEAQS